MSRVWVGICPSCRLWAEFYEKQCSEAIEIKWLSECCHSSKDIDYLEEIIMDDDSEVYKNLSGWSQ